MVPDGRKYNRDQVKPILEKILADMGEESFSKARLLEIERMARRASPQGFYLPGKTVLREIINQFRIARWPEATGKTLGRRF